MEKGFIVIDLLKLDAKGNKEWKKRATLVDSRDSVQDIEFSPSHLSLKIVFETVFFFFF